eukprot:scaffold5718_cov112-Skeletonema_dohrnii-CCMP3373.AAC.8
MVVDVICTDLGVHNAGNQIKVALAFDYLYHMKRNDVYVSYKGHMQNTSAVYELFTGGQFMRIQACRLAQRSSDEFIEAEAFGLSPLEVGSGSFSSVYEIQDFHLRSNHSEIYSEEQVKKREATAKSVKNGKRYVMKCLKDKLEDSYEEGLFIGAAQDIVHEAEMLAALSHPNIIKLQGVVASRHMAFLEGASEFFIIMERLDSTLADKIEVWRRRIAPSNHLCLCPSRHSAVGASVAVAAERWLQTR